MHDSMDNRSDIHKYLCFFSNQCRLFVNHFIRRTLTYRRHSTIVIFYRTRLHRHLRGRFEVGSMSPLSSRSRCSYIQWVASRNDPLQRNKLFFTSWGTSVLTSKATAGISLESNRKALARVFPKQRDHTHIIIKTNNAFFSFFLFLFFEKKV